MRKSVRRGFVTHLVSTEIAFCVAPPGKIGKSLLLKFPQIWIVVLACTSVWASRGLGRVVWKILDVLCKVKLDSALI